MDVLERIESADPPARADRAGRRGRLPRLRRRRLDLPLARARRARLPRLGRPREPRPARRASPTRTPHSAASVLGAEVIDAPAGRDRGRAPRPALRADGRPTGCAPPATPPPTRSRPSSTGSPRAARPAGSSPGARTASSARCSPCGARRPRRTARAHGLATRARDSSNPDTLRGLIRDGDRAAAPPAPPGRRGEHPAARRRAPAAPPRDGGDPARAARRTAPARSREIWAAGSRRCASTTRSRSSRGPSAGGRG